MRAPRDLVHEKSRTFVECKEKGQRGDGHLLLWNDPVSEPELGLGLGQKVFDFLGLEKVKKSHKKLLYYKSFISFFLGFLSHFEFLVTFWPKKLVLVPQN